MSIIKFFKGLVKFIAIFIAIFLLLVFILSRFAKETENTSSNSSSQTEVKKTDVKSSPTPEPTPKATEKPSSTPSQNEVTLNKEYKSFSSDYFSVDYPRKWELSKQDSSITIYNTKSKTGFKDHILVQIQKPSFGNAPSLDKLVDAMEKEMYSNDDPYMSNFKIDSSEITTHQNYESAKIISRFEVRKTGIEVINYYLIIPVGKNVFFLSYATKYDDANQTEANDFFDQLVSTFKIN